MKKLILITVCVLIAVFAYIIVNNDGSCNRKFSRTLQTIDVIDDDIKGYSKGVSGAFAGISNDMLILAGGCNFPDIPVSEGGKKVYYSSIYGMKIGSLKKEKWEKIGDLPFPLAYGVTVESGNSLYLIGGNNNDSSKSDVFKLTYIDGKINLESMKPMPVKIDNMAGCVVENKIYIMGGNADGKPSNRFFTFDLEDEDGDWKELDSFPGDARVQPVCVGGEREFILVGGFFPGDAGLLKAPTLSLTPLVYDCNKNTWKNASVPECEVDDKYDVNGNKLCKQIAFVGGSGARLCDNRALLAGGVDKDVFYKAIEREYNIKIFAGDSVKLSKLLEEKKDYLLQDENYYEFNEFLMGYDFNKDKWSIIHSMDLFAKAGASLVRVTDNTFYWLNGEVKPGVRTNKNYLFEMFD